MVVTVNNGNSLILPLTATATQTQFNNLFCRPNCYKLLIAIVLVFLLMQFTANFVAYKHKFNISQSIPLNGLHWSSSGSLHQIISRTVEPTNRTINNSNASSSTLLSQLMPSHNNNSLNSDIKRTLNSINSNTGSIFKSASDSVISLFNDSITTTSSPQLCPLIPPKLGKPFTS